jgi:hypothetical protein
MSTETSDASEDALSSIPTFKELVDISKWQPVEDYFRTSDDVISSDVRSCVELRKKLRQELLADSDIRGKVRRPSEDELARASDILFAGEVCGIDGTISVVPSQSGGRARIGVASTSYSGEGIKRVLYVSYRQLATPAGSAIEYFRRLKQVNRTSALLMRAVMAYAERSLALQQPNAWRFVHGELLPYELWAALGKGRPVKERLDLARSLIQARNVIAIVEGTQNIELLNAGEILEPGEYLDARELTMELKEYLEGHRDDGRGAHFNPQDRRDFEDFIDSQGVLVRVGVFKAGPKPYVFHAHRDVFDQAAALVVRDAMHQPMRGFPLLLDYADRICAYHLKSSDFDKQIQFKTARLGWEALATEIDPRKTRRS